MTQFTLKTVSEGNTNLRTTADINPMTLKLDGDWRQRYSKMYPHTENEAASVRHSKLELKNTKMSQDQRSRPKTKSSKLL